jgi:hypothetical protein
VCVCVYGTVTQFPETPKSKERAALDNNYYSMSVGAVCGQISKKKRSFNRPKKRGIVPPLPLPLPP